MDAYIKLSISLLGAEKHYCLELKKTLWFKTEDEMITAYSQLQANYERIRNIKIEIDQYGVGFKPLRRERTIPMLFTDDEAKRLYEVFVHRNMKTSEDIEIATKLAREISEFYTEDKIPDD